MADVHRPLTQQQQHQQQQQPLTESIKSLIPDKGPSATQVLAVATLFPVGGILLGLSGITLVGTIIGLCLATPVFLIFSPILVPAALAIGLAVLGFLSSGALGVTGLSSLSWMVNYLRGVRATVPEQMEHMKRRAQEAVGQIGQRTKDVGQSIQSRAGTESTTGGRSQESTPTTGRT